MENTEGKVLELSIDGHVTITTERFAELAKKEEQLDIIRQVYRNSKSYVLDDLFKCIFKDITPENGDDNA